MPATATMSVWPWSIAVTGDPTAGTCLMNSIARNWSWGSAPQSLSWWRRHLYRCGRRQPSCDSHQSPTLLSPCFPVPSGPCPVGPRRPHAAVVTASPETTSATDRRTARTAAMSWTVDPHHPVSPMSSPVGMDIVPSSCGAVMVILTVRTELTKPTAVSIRGSSGGLRPAQVACSCPVFHSCPAFHSCPTPTLHLCFPPSPVPQDCLFALPG